MKKFFSISRDNRSKIYKFILKAKNGKLCLKLLKKGTGLKQNCKLSNLNDVLSNFLIKKLYVKLVNAISDVINILHTN